MTNFRTITGLNVRSGPGTEYEVLDTWPQGEIFEEVDAAGWCPVRLQDEDGAFLVGWLSRKYLKDAPDVPIPPDSPKPAPAGVTGAKVVARAMTQAGDPYIFGYEVDLTDPDPDAFDCSELVQWACAQLGVKPTMPDGAIYQYEHCKNQGTLITIEKAVKTVGALLFRISSSGNHVVISRGDGSTIEAKGSAYGVGVFSATGRGFTHAALIPGVIYAG